MSIFASWLSSVTTFRGLVALDHGDLPVAHVDEILRVFDDRRGVGREKILALADAHDHRAALSCGDDPVGVSLFDDGDGIGPDHLAKLLLHGFEPANSRRLANIFDQVHNTSNRCARNV